MGDNANPKRSATMDQLLTNEYGLRTHPSNESGPQTVGNLVVKLLSNNPNRVGLTFINLGAQNAYLYLNGQVSSTNGIFLAANGGSIALNWRDDMTLITNEWDAIAPGGNTTIQVLSVETL